MEVIEVLSKTVAAVWRHLLRCKIMPANIKALECGGIWSWMLYLCILWFSPEKLNRLFILESIQQPDATLTAKPPLKWSKNIHHFWQTSLQEHRLPDRHDVSALYCLVPRQKTLKATVTASKVKWGMWRHTLSFQTILTKKHPGISSWNESSRYIQWNDTALCARFLSEGQRVHVAVRVSVCQVIGWPSQLSRNQ